MRILKDPREYATDIEAFARAHEATNREALDMVKAVYTMPRSYWVEVEKALGLFPLVSSCA